MLGSHGTVRTAVRVRIPAMTDSRAMTAGVTTTMTMRRNLFLAKKVTVLDPVCFLFHLPTRLPSFLGPHATSDAQQLSPSTIHRLVPPHCIVSFLVNSVVV